MADLVLYGAGSDVLVRAVVSELSLGSDFKQQVEVTPVGMSEQVVLPLAKVRPLAHVEAAERLLTGLARAKRDMAYSTRDTPAFEDAQLRHEQAIRELEYLGQQLLEVADQQA